MPPDGDPDAWKKGVTIRDITQKYKLRNVVIGKVGIPFLAKHGDAVLMKASGPWKAIPVLQSWLSHRFYAHRHRPCQIRRQAMAN